MKQIALLILLFFSIFVQAQVSPGQVIRVVNNTTAFGVSVPVGSIIYDNTTKLYWGVITPQVSTQRIVDCTVDVNIKELTNTGNAGSATNSMEYSSSYVGSCAGSGSSSFVVLADYDFYYTAEGGHALLIFNGTFTATTPNQGFKLKYSISNSVPFKTMATAVGSTAINICFPYMIAVTRGTSYHIQMLWEANSNISTVDATAWGLSPSTISIADLP